MESTIPVGQFRKLIKKLYNVSAALSGAAVFSRKSLTKTGNYVMLIVQRISAFAICVLMRIRHIRIVPQTGKPKWKNEKLNTNSNAEDIFITGLEFPRNKILVGRKE